MSFSAKYFQRTTFLLPAIVFNRQESGNRERCVAQSTSESRIRKRGSKFTREKIASSVPSCRVRLCVTVVTLKCYDGNAVFPRRPFFHRRRNLPHKKVQMLRKMTRIPPVKTRAGQTRLLQFSIRNAAVRDRLTNRGGDHPIVESTENISRHIVPSSLRTMSPSAILGHRHQTHRTQNAEHARVTSTANEPTHEGWTHRRTRPSRSLSTRL